ncbi:hypothetical protein CDEST_08619 [Colletotrichum destructivum]|uniref:Uncharacterized protein n=1 Tax=Colletotrichum destructivum TaxID=34406 RepID=A0AAX4IJE4_9PEZI|nr:hypothetical protein CDEST_08619 [Colletotrichum destructivum]
MVIVCVLVLVLVLALALVQVPVALVAVTCNLLAFWPRSRQIRAYLQVPTTCRPTPCNCQLLPHSKSIVSCNVIYCALASFSPVSHFSHHHNHHHHHYFLYQPCLFSTCNNPLSPPIHPFPRCWPSLLLLPLSCLARPDLGVSLPPLSPSSTAPAAATFGLVSLVLLHTFIILFSQILSIFKFFALRIISQAQSTPPWRPAPPPGKEEFERKGRRREGEKKKKKKERTPTTQQFHPRSLHCGVASLSFPDPCLLSTGVSILLYHCCCYLHLPTHPSTAAVAVVVQLQKPDQIRYTSRHLAPLDTKHWSTGTHHHHHLTSFTCALPCLPLPCLPLSLPSPWHLLLFHLGLPCHHHLVFCSYLPLPPPPPKPIPTRPPTPRLLPTTETTKTRHQPRSNRLRVLPPTYLLSHLPHLNRLLGSPTKKKEGPSWAIVDHCSLTKEGALLLYSPSSCLTHFQFLFPIPRASCL